MPEINFFWDPLSDNILQERDETGAVTAEYTTEPGLHGNLISQNRGGTESQYHFDAQGSTLALTNDSQQVTDTYSFAMNPLPLSLRISGRANSSPCLSRGNTAL